MPLASRWLLPAGGQSLQSILAHRLQHVEPRFSLELLLLTEQALVDEGSNAREDIKASLGIDDCLGRFDGAAAGKDGQLAKQCLVCGREQIVTPGDGITHRLLSGRKRTRPAGQQRQALLQALEQGLRRQDLNEGRGKFNRQGKAVEPRADLSDRGSVLIRDFEIRFDRLRPRNEEAYRFVLSQALE
jgi:hypothetical protein